MSAGLEQTFAVKRFDELSNWSLLWYCRARLWDVAQRQFDKRRFWYDHRPILSPLYISSTGHDAYYVKLGYELDRLISNQDHVLGGLQQQLKKLPKSFPSDARLAFQAVQHLTEANLQEADHEERRTAEYRYWLYRAQSRLQGYVTSRWWGTYDVARCRAQVARYDQFASTRYPWWHALVGWWQNMAHKRKIVALADVCDELQSATITNTTLDHSLKTLAHVDADSNMLISSIHSLQCTYVEHYKVEHYMSCEDEKLIKAALTLDQEDGHAAQLLHQLPNQVGQLLDIYKMVQRADMVLSDDSEDLSEIMRYYQFGLMCFDRLKNLYKAFSTMQPTEGCDTEVWTLFHAKVPSHLTQMQLMLKQKLIAYEVSLAEKIQQNLKLRPSIKTCLSRLVSLLRKNDARLYDHAFRQQQVEQFVLSGALQHIFKLTHVSPILGELYSDIEQTLQNELKQLMSFWQLAAEIKLWRENIKAWKKTHAKDLKYLKRFKFKNQSPQNLKQAWAVFQKLQTSFYELEMPIDLSCRCDISSISKEPYTSQPLPMGISEVLARYTDPCDGRVHIGYYNTTVFETHDYRDLKPNGGILLYQEGLGRWYIQAKDKHGKRRVSNTPLEEGFNKKDVTNCLDLMEYLAQNDSMLMRNWPWESGLAISQQLARWLGEPVYCWKYQLEEVQFIDIALQPFFEWCFYQHIGLMAPISQFYKQFHQARNDCWKHFCNGIVGVVLDQNNEVQLCLQSLKFAIRTSPSDWSLLVSAFDTRLPNHASDYKAAPLAILSVAEHQRCQEILSEIESVRLKLWAYYFDKVVGLARIKIFRLKTSLIECVIGARNEDIEQWILQVQSNPDLQKQFALVKADYQNVQKMCHHSNLVRELKRIPITPEYFTEEIDALWYARIPKLQQDFAEIRELLTVSVSLANYIFKEILVTITRGCDKLQCLQGGILDWHHYWETNQQFGVAATFHMGAETLGYKRQTEALKREIEASKREMVEERRLRRLGQRKHRINGLLSEFGQFSHDFRAPLSSLYEAVGRYIGCELTPLDDITFSSHRVELESLISTLNQPIALISVGDDGNVEDETYLHNDWIKQHPLWGQAETIPVFYDYEQNLYGYIDCQEQDRAQAVFAVVDQLLIAQPSQKVSITAHPSLFARAQTSATETLSVDSQHSSGYDSGHDV